MSVNLTTTGGNVVISISINAITKPDNNPPIIPPIDPPKLFIIPPTDLGLLVVPK